MLEPKIHCTAAVVGDLSHGQQRLYEFVALRKRANVIRQRSLSLLQKAYRLHSWCQESVCGNWRRGEELVERKRPEGIKSATPKVVGDANKIAQRISQLECKFLCVMPRWEISPGNFYHLYCDWSYKYQERLNATQELTSAGYSCGIFHSWRQVGLHELDVGHGSQKTQGKLD